MKKAKLNKKIIELFDEMIEKEIITDYALGGGVAVEYYINPPATQDIDFFVIVENVSLDMFGAVYAFLLSKGGKFENQHIRIEGELIDILPAEKGLTRDAVRTATLRKIGTTVVRVIEPLFLAGILNFCGRPKDFKRINEMLEKNVIKYDELVGLCLMYKS